MSPQEEKLWVFLDETLPANEGNALLGTLVANVQFPTNGYVPKSAPPSRQHPFLIEKDILEPSVEDRFISADNSKGSSFDAGLYNFLSGNFSSSNTRQATLSSRLITTYNLREPSDVFQKIRSTPVLWKQVEELMQRNNGKPLYFVRGYKVASNPDISLESSKQRSYGGEMTAPVVETFTSFPVGDPHIAATWQRGTMDSQSGTVTNERLFAIQYWSVVTRRESVQGKKRSLIAWSRSKRTEDISPGIPSGNHNKFSGGKDAARKASGEELNEEGEEEEEEEEDDDDDDDDDYDDDDEYGDQEEWVLAKRSVNMENIV